MDRRFELTGGAACLDFVNTLGDRPRSRDEGLRAYADLVAWGRQAGVLPGAEAKGLRREAARHPVRAREALARAVALREELYRVFSRVAAGRAPDERGVGALNEALAAALVRLRVRPGPSGFDWAWTARPGDLDRVLWPVVRSAAELLTSAEREQVRECGGEACSWLFVDRSRTRRRRWCDMKTCGNRAKARRHYRRTRASRTE
ncbi:MAG TPA: ABATE domain-containing protein [Vicinamibacteria bacterium]|nr:ABATE domain-containing protein [Vicinamibacteria bacterium]